MTRSEHTPADVQAALITFWSDVDHDGDGVELPMAVIAHAQRSIASLDADADYDLCGPRTNENIRGERYISGPSITFWEQGSDLGVMIAADAHDSDGKVYANGYTSLVQWG
jgi:hypothetical protein